MALRFVVASSGSENRALNEVPTFLTDDEILGIVYFTSHGDIDGLFEAVIEIRLTGGLQHDSSKSLTNKFD